MQKHTKHFREFRATTLERERRLVCNRLEQGHLDLMQEMMVDPVGTTARINAMSAADKARVLAALGNLSATINSPAPSPAAAPAATPSSTPAAAPSSTPAATPAATPSATPAATPAPSAQAPSVWAQRGQLAMNTAIVGTGATAASAVAFPSVSSALTSAGAWISSYVPALGTVGSAAATAAPWALGIGAPLWVLGKFSRGYQNAQLNSADVSAEEKKEIKKRLDRDWGVWFANDIHLGVETVYHLATQPLQDAIEGAGSMWHGALSWTGGAIKTAFNTVTAPLGKPVALLGGAAGAGAAAIGVPAALAAAGGTVALGPVGLGLAVAAGGYMGYRWMKDYWYKSASAS